MQPISKHFEHKLNAPFHCVRQSWGAENQNTVFLRTWSDKVSKHPVKGFKVHIHNPEREDKGFGNTERGEHIDAYKQGKPMYLVMCVAKDANSPKREIKSYNAKELFKVTGLITDEDGQVYAHCAEPRTPISKFK